MSKSRRFLLGILSMLPLLLFLGYMIIFFSFFITIFKHAQPEDILTEMILAHIGWIIGIALLMAFSMLGLLIYFIIHVINNKLVDGTEQIVWVLVFIFAGMIGFPVYWYMRIWKEAGSTVSNV
ncbi:MAG: hypothetical protein ABJB86_24290 [Bacteroidota bacterium]